MLHDLGTLLKEKEIVKIITSIFFSYILYKEMNSKYNAELFLN